MASTKAQLAASKAHKAKRLAEGFRPVTVWLSAEDLAWIAAVAPMSREAVIRAALAAYVAQTVFGRIA